MLAHKKIMFFAHDPGGCNAILSLIDAFRARSCDVHVGANGPAQTKIPQASILHVDEIDRLLKDVKPDFIITGTSANDFTEKFLWKAAENRHIPAMAVLDHWCNYGVRFSRYGSKNIHEYESNKTFDFRPSYICVMDDFAKSEMQLEGIPPNIIYPLGNPHFGTIKKRAQLVDIAKIRSKFLQNNQDKKIISFASEPYEEDYGISPEIKAMYDIIQVLGDHDDAIVVIKIHPRESQNKYSKFTQCIVDRETDSIEMIMASDIVISVSSMVLIEAAILGKKIISHQPGEVDGNKFILTRNGVLPFLNNFDGLRSTINRLLNAPEMLYSFPVDFNAVENIVAFVEEKLCRN
jgi:hypothetical protein